ncbi:MAG: helix-hairpin-helix domain-containing protein [Desulfurivibrionaceae bacterium]|nr:helix-hairpin-helix domain-containing protein [Desulfurivibrionaceae bacterium]
MKKLMTLCALFLFWAQIAIAGVNINTADQNSLEGLPGIGPAKASAIIDYRTTHGNFASADDLTKVKGIGEKILVKIHDQVEVQ